MSNDNLTIKEYDAHVELTAPDYACDSGSEPYSLVRINEENARKLVSILLKKFIIKDGDRYLKESSVCKLLDELPERFGGDEFKLALITELCIDSIAAAGDIDTRDLIQGVPE